MNVRVPFCGGRNRAAVSLTRAHRLGVRGYVRVSASSSVLVQRLARDLSVFVRDNPEVRLALQEQPSELTMAAVLNKKVDIGIIVRDSPADGLRVIDYSGDRLAIAAVYFHRRFRPQGDGVFARPCRCAGVGLDRADDRRGAAAAIVGCVNVSPSRWRWNCRMAGCGMFSLARGADFRDEFARVRTRHRADHPMPGS